MKRLFIVTPLPLIALALAGLQQHRLDRQDDLSKSEELAKTLFRNYVGQAKNDVDELLKSQGGNQPRDETSGRG